MKPFNRKQVCTCICVVHGGAIYSYSRIRSLQAALRSAKRFHAEVFIFVCSGIRIMNEECAHAVCLSVCKELERTTDFCFEFFLFDIFMYIATPSWVVFFLCLLFLLVLLCRIITHTICCAAVHGWCFIRFSSSAFSEVKTIAWHVEKSHSVRRRRNSGFILQPALLLLDSAASDQMNFYIANI